MRTKNKTPARKRYDSFSDEEKSAMKDRVREMKRGDRDEDAEAEVLAKIGEMGKPDREMGKRIHAVIKAAAPALTPRLWYGMPAYAKDGKLVCHFQPAQKFKTRYATLGFSDAARLDDGSIWPNAYAVTEITPAVENKIAALVKKAVG
jgi:hypothetical protein